MIRVFSTRQMRMPARHVLKRCCCADMLLITLFAARASRRHFRQQRCRDKDIFAHRCFIFLSPPRLRFIFRALQTPQPLSAPLPFAIFALLLRAAAIRARDDAVRAMICAQRWRQLMRVISDTRQDYTRYACGAAAPEAIRGDMPR